MKSVLAGLLLFFLAGQVQASCWEEAARAYGIDPLLLRAVSWVESNDRADAIGPKLEDGNRALGKMQINTVHLPELKPYGVTKEMLFDECVNIKVGAWIAARCIARFGHVWKAIGCYNTGPASKNVEAQQRYVALVSEAYAQYKRNPNATPRIRTAKSEKSRAELVGGSVQRTSKTGYTGEFRTWGDE
ncbi:MULTISPECIES: lytic transglycosylase domain-containing protein [Herbaspirillum]|uniref:lytic transglycosylase domain-containing protein n=1 Tax=Herbaspirillum TaxID=963 RepID=UPI000C0AD25F|nr:MULTISPECIES: lytic transglycosylase domain-containing protein [Herbaspirillum]MAF04673.1 lytic transglycosylase [Herbaspirillum sp.]UWE19358.1 lytic transglycosylase domain-containing protein [Herbaspirillum huttiense]|tara:strand:+ start:4596 stop:5159 length:564 start_codon:yes stop_codon:yes gene_type:complete